ncbi:unnamed protein product [[Candida] boidinii]|uniref:Aldehyde dehydrogenase 5, mitochondrial n=1 Tax=Candida boidinii TaxID=5477 RepID=A0A9W6SX63_CANBO|nr:hypothetical protein BVG19_g4230 [[Candida] boidinii]OWB53363.1 hypothetical protein B5S27_g4958 [[Candida] boidinii]OWB68501.1 hypothetical protein B5S30_g3882 [[Candida] boidinii]OWB81563.1 hypothetical protein B5S33_g182 [[Candida] boidinii]GME68798.1 unnamed protein product [[Candida] boidinii]
MSLTATLKFPIINESVEQPTGLFINNEFVPAIQGKTFAVTSPIDESHLCDLQMANADDVEVAVKAAYKAFQSWKVELPSVRARYLYKLADLIDQHRETIAKIESLDNGKSLLCSRFDVNLVVNYIRSCAGFADKCDGRTINTGANYLNFTKREPLGVCGQIIPWNFPIMMFAWKIGPALATGNCVVLKPASATPLSALYVCKLVQEAGIPAGVINVIPGSGRGCGNAILKHPLVKKVAFTGSTEIGKQVMIDAADSVKKVTLELGGKSPNIVFDDCNLERTVQNLITGIFFNGGEVCCAGSRIYIQDTVYDKVLEAFKEAISKLKIGNPFEEGVFQGAQTTPDQFQTVLDYIKIGKESGAKVLTGGERIGDKGYFVQPTVLYDCSPDMRIVEEEIFGPVAAVSKFTTIDDLIEKANNSIYGLAAGIHTEDLNKAFIVADRLEAGSVWINTYNDLHENVPFGGYKESGIGREMGQEAFDNYTQVKAVRVKLNTPSI